MAIVLMTACSRQGSVFPLPIAQARQILATTGLPPEVFGSEPPDFEVRDSGAQVAWILKYNGAELFRYVAHLTQEDQNATRVEVELSVTDKGAAQRLAERPEVRDLYLVAINERIASALEQRPFEMSRIYPSLGVVVMANMGSIQASADAAAAASEQADRENIRKAYRDEAAGLR